MQMATMPSESERVEDLRQTLVNRCKQFTDYLPGRPGDAGRIFFDVNSAVNLGRATGVARVFYVSEEDTATGVKLCLISTCPANGKGVTLYRIDTSEREPTADSIYLDVNQVEGLLAALSLYESP